MRTSDAVSRWSAPRLIGVSAGLVGALVLGLVAYTGGAAAAIGPTDLSITKTDSPDPVVQGSNLTYTITVSNSGANDAGSVVVTDNLSSPSDVDYVSSSTTAGTCKKSANTVTCDLGTVLSGTSQTVTIVVKAKHAGTLSNTATVASPNDANGANNSATASTTVISAKPGKNVKPSCATPTIAGTPGPDVITGTALGDVIVTYGGNDVIYAGGGPDLICAGKGADAVFAGPGKDIAIGGGGRDRLFGGRGGDILKGKNGRDRLRGGPGNDFLNGGKKRDNCKGGPGHNILRNCP